MIDPILLGKARSLVARLELISHGKSMSWDPGRGGEGALFPPGGVNRDDDRDPDSLILRSHLHYRRRLAGVRSGKALELVVGEMEQTLRAWTHSARPPVDSPAWREMVGLQKGDVKEIAAEWGISASRVYQLRRQYREEAA